VLLSACSRAGSSDSASDSTVSTATPLIITTPEQSEDNERGALLSVARTFLEALQTEAPGGIDEAFKERYFTQEFREAGFEDKLVGALAGVSLMYGESVRINDSQYVLKVDTSRKNEQDKPGATLAITLKKEGTWKVHALKEIAWPGFIHEIRKYLRSISNPTPEQQWELRDNNSYFTTKDEMLLQFEQNRALFDSIGAELRAQEKLELICRLGYSQYRINQEFANTEAEIEAALSKYGIGKDAYNRYMAAIDQLNVSCIEVLSNKSVKFLKAGMLNDALGYLYRPDGAAQTELEYGWREEEIADGWFYYEE